MTFGASTIAVPPGESIREQLEDRGLSQKEFALRMGMSEKHISHLINGKTELTPQTAQRLESVLSVPAHFWLNLEVLYREALVKALAEIEMETDIKTVKKFPYSEMAKLGWIKDTKNQSDKVWELRKFFEVANLGIIDSLKIPGIAYRVANSNDTKDYALAAWAQKARIEARNIKCSPINIQKLQKNLSHIREFTTEKPQIFCNKLQEIMSSCGIAIIFLPHIGGSFLHGASFVDNNHIVMGLTVRGKDADKFWFSLFHEVYHILAGDINNNEPKSPEQEEACDLFAQNTLIPKNEFEAFIARQNFTKSSIINFANSINIDVGIVIGRLQKECYIKFSVFNDLKTHYVIT